MNSPLTYTNWQAVLAILQKKAKTFLNNCGKIQGKNWIRKLSKCWVLDTKTYLYFIKTISRAYKFEHLMLCILLSIVSMLKITLSLEIMSSYISHSRMLRIRNIIVPVDIGLFLIKKSLALVTYCDVFIDTR